MFSLTRFKNQHSEHQTADYKVSETSYAITICKWGKHNKKNYVIDINLSSVPCHLV